MYYILNIVFIVLAFFNVYADDAAHLNNFNFCAKTEGVVDDYEPVVFVKNNNLLRKTGAVVQNAGNIIIIKGTVLNDKCNPVQGAIVYLWHANHNGKYVYSPLRTNVNKELISLNNDDSFLGNGTAVTNTKGEFRFVTIEPGSLLNLSPYLNVRCIYRNKIAAQTSFKLKELDAKEDSIENYSVHDIGDRKKSKQNMIKTYHMQIVLSDTMDHEDDE